ncbi:MAG: biotin/lipoyl-binding protein [Anaerolineae bacterium]
MKRWRLWLALVIVLMVAGFGLYTAYSWYLQFPVRRPSAAQTVSPVRMDLRREVPAYGQVVASTPVPADFDVGGTIAVVHVARGDSVVAGELLAELEREPLQLAVASAEAGVRAAQAQIDRLRRTPSDEDIAALEAGVEVARRGVQTAEALVVGANANLTAATAGSGPEELAIAAKRIEDAKASLWGAQAHRDALCGRVGKGVSEADCDNAEAAVATRAASGGHRRAAVAATAGRPAPRGRGPLSRAGAAEPEQPRDGARTAQAGRGGRGQGAAAGAA